MQEFKYIASYEILTAAVLKHLRQYTQGGQVDVAKISDIPKSTLSRLEAGEAKLTVEYLAILCDVYGIKTSEFFNAVEICTEYLQKEQSTLIHTERQVLNQNIKTIKIDATALNSPALGMTAGSAVAAALKISSTIVPISLVGAAVSAITAYKNKGLIDKEKLMMQVGAEYELSQQDLLKICHNKLSEYWVELAKKHQEKMLENR